MKRATICTLLFFFCLCNIYVTAQVRKSPNYDGYWNKSAKVYKNPASKFYWDLSDLQIPFDMRSVIPAICGHSFFKYFYGCKVNVLNRYLGRQTVFFC